ncbi:hypothetical protein GE21DRAFT_5344 [Neurospora crassa]|uniref:Gfd2/YDR514C-like C-terminal domain-containing protein n=1 Tax=Neurospora crassa (strain ATCC 24698 / 74-OR23-1A / CBS 708.71 / DSM 1257 / FGSC 987) TaxID=367110 RepID=Q7S1D9_NEUCR|nr:hypothetical protein NCU04896 [Neurospora crassa OR74A]EAA29169.1 hypothetical protein NCU04896 [Neurospora crassa OR74A]KHE78845.1 hypothetical protein GE21DRAFT_5344 [Neurospora crassa]|eukprot:XP_958405.1 hypothetical protein NCU04896 [Neurospora crassa OR74A]
MKSTCPPPPAVHSYAELVDFRKTYMDTIFVSIDIENIDHQPNDRPMEKLSEMGVAVFDPRGGSSNSEVEQIQDIQVRHTIIDEWAWVTAKTCPNRRRAWHCGAHKPSPYTAMFCISNIQSSQKVMSQLTDYFRILQNQHLTETEVADGIRRKVVVLSWDSNAESQLFNDHAYNFTSINDIEHWDFQLWLPVLHRFGHRNKTGAEKFYATTGVLGLENCSITLHNASNDAWAQVATLIRFFHMSKEEFSHWVQAEEDLKPLDLSWVDLQILHHNAALEQKYKRFPNHNGLSGVSLAMHPDLPGQAMSRNGRHHQNPNPPPAINDNSAFPGLPPRIQKIEAPPRVTWGAKSNAQHLFKTNESREIGKGLGTEIPKRLETKPAPKSCWSVPLSFGSSSPSPSSATTSPNQSTPASTPSSSLPSASVSRTPSPPTPATNGNAPASSSTATIVNNGSNNFLSHHESASVRDHGAAGSAKEDGQCLSRDVPKRKKRGKKKGQVAGAEKAFDSLGALGAEAGGMAVLHNAANDTFTQVVAFLRFMVMTEAEWKNWRGRSDFYPGDLDPVDLSWISDETWKANQELGPLLQPGERPDEVEEPEDPEPEPVIVHHSAMAEIEAGVIFTTVDSAIESRS